ncbi:hypothetical protein QKW52_28680 [Bacillus sonorensis]|nr:hypothetical protein [Bacillus sonorensis]
MKSSAFIAFAKNGMPVLQFENKGQYERYVKLQLGAESRGRPSRGLSKPTLLLITGT